MRDLELKIIITNSKIKLRKDKKLKDMNSSELAM